MRRFSFPKARRLVSNSQFRTVFSRRLTIRDENIVLYARENGLDYSRLGITLGRSCGKAVVRNRLKRLIREAFRQNRQNIPAGYDYVITTAGRGKADIRALNFKKIQNSLLTLAAWIASKPA